MNNKIKLKFIAFIFSILIISGTMGYSLILKTSIIDSLYMTIITISTVGYSEIAIMTPAAKIFSMLLIFSGVGIGGYTFTTFVGIIIEGKIKDLWRNRMAENKISRLKDHYILCGAGEIGEVIIEQFKHKNESFVVIEKDEDTYRETINKGILTILGDATDETILEKAQIYKSKGLISTLSKDVDNIVTVLTARQMNKELYIVSRSIDKNAPEKLKKAGANKTISPSEIGGRRMAAQLTKPNVISFLDVVTHIGDIELCLEDISINDGAEIIGKSLMDLRLPKQTGLLVLAIKKQDSEELLISPNLDDTLFKGDSLLILGTTSQITRIRELANDSIDD
jgi:voltage-gated potassium channel